MKSLDYYQVVIVFGKTGKDYVVKKMLQGLGGLGDTLGGITDAVAFSKYRFDRKGSDWSVLDQS